MGVSLHSSYSFNWTFCTYVRNLVDGMHTYVRTYVYVHVLFYFVCACTRICTVHTHVCMHVFSLALYMDI